MSNTDPVTITNNEAKEPEYAGLLRSISGDAIAGAYVRILILSKR